MRHGRGEDKWGNSTDKFSKTSRRWMNLDWKCHRMKHREIRKCKNWYYNEIVKYPKQRKNSNYFLRERANNPSQSFDIRRLNSNTGFTRQWSNIFLRCLKQRYIRPGILYPAKLPFQCHKIIVRHTRTHSACHTKSHFKKTSWESTQIKKGTYLADVGDSWSRGEKNYL